MRILPALVAVYLIWGSTYLAIRFAVETIPPFLMAGSRFLISGVILYAWVRLRGVPRPTFRQWRSATIVGCFLLLGGNGIVVWAEQTVPSGLASLLVSTVPVWMVLLDSFRAQGQRLTKGVILGIALGFAGVAILVDPLHLSVATTDVRGVFALLVASLFWAIGSLYARQAELPVSPFMTTSMEMIAGGVLLLLMGGVAGEFSSLSMALISDKSWMSFAYLTFIGSLGGFTAYIWLLHNTSVAIASTYAYVNPLVALLLGCWIGHEALQSRTIFGASMILTGVAVITLVQSRRKKS